MTITLNVSLVAGSKANAFWHVGTEMARQEGFQSLMSGFTASMLREVSYSGLRLGAYEYFKDKCGCSARDST
jgi:hypothetical protein